MKKNVSNDEIKLFNIANFKGIAEASESDAPRTSPIEGVKGWRISSYSADKAGVDLIVLECEANADINPLHSGGDVFWLGYVAEGSLELILGDNNGKQTSSRFVNQGDHLLFEPDTYHGWIPGGHAAKIIFIKTN